MFTPRRVTSIATVGLLLASIAATRFVTGRAGDALSVHRASGLCDLLTAAEASAALEAKSLPGKAIVDSTACAWSDDPAVSDSSRRVTLSSHTVRAFQFAMRPAIKTIQIEPVSGIGDEAFFQIYPNNQSPFIWVRKGNKVFAIRILTQLKPKPFTIEQEKAKEAVLAKAAVARF